MNVFKRKDTESSETGKSNKRNKMSTKKDLIEPEITYLFAHGYRYVVPYQYYYLSTAKPRWSNRTIMDVFTTDFVAFSKEYYENAIKIGNIRLTDRVVPPDYVIKLNDQIIHMLHRHEPPVLAQCINIVYETPELIIVDKPPSMPVHPCGKYKYNSLIGIMEKELGLNLHLIHRLDRLTSGLLLLARTSAASSCFSKQLRDGKFIKQYVARVVGFFPDEICVDQPIDMLDPLLGIQAVMESGKQAVTLFKRLSFNGHSSVVLCQPVTGRTHQIRVHLQWLGHPICNDPNYGGCLYLSNSDMNGIFKVIPPLCVSKVQCSSKLFIGNQEATQSEDVVDEAERFKSAKLVSFDDSAFTLGSLLEPVIQNKVIELFNKREDSSARIPEVSKLKGVLPEEVKESAEVDDLFPNCENCHNGHYWDDKGIHTTFIWLHAYRYTSPDWSFQVPLPVWAEEDYNSLEQCQNELRRCKDGPDD